MSKKIDLVKDFEAMVNGSPALDRVRLDASEVAIIPFTAEAAQVDIHYCKEPDINDYVICNGGRLLPLQDRSREDGEATAMPVYMPAARAVGVLPVRTSLRPRALWPQLAQVLKDGLRRRLYSSRGCRATATPSRPVPLQADVDRRRRGAITDLLGRPPEGDDPTGLRLPQGHQRAARGDPRDRRMLQLKGIKVG